MQCNQNQQRFANMKKLSNFCVWVLAFAFELDLISLGTHFLVVADSTIPTIEELRVGCNVTKGCISGCFNEPSCPVVMTYRKDVDYYHFELLADISGHTGYVAMGLSRDKEMGHDVVVECVKYGSTLGMFQSWNKIYENFRIPDTACPGGGMHGLVNCTVTVEDGKIYCKFTRYRVIAHQFMSIGRSAMHNSKFYVLLVTGGVVDEKGIKEHYHPSYATPFAIDFNKLTQRKPDNLQNRMAHVYLMTIIWVIFVPNAMFVARYLKETMTDTICCERKLWFFGHTSLMSLGFILCVSSICCIMWNRSYNDSKWPKIPSSLQHAQIGLIATTLFLVQIVSGWYRPSGRGSRKTYSVIHAFLGTVAYFLALTNFIRSYYMGMPCYIYWVVIGALLWQALWHIFMILHYVWLDGNLGLKQYRALSPAPIKVVLFEDAPGRKQRLRITVINFIGSCVFAVGLCVTYNNVERCPCEEDFCKRIPHIS